MEDFIQSPAELPQWICWATEDRNGKPTKVPYYAHSQGENPGLRLASSTDPSTWHEYDYASAAKELFEFDGVGFVFTKDDPFCGVDLDKCLDPKTGRIETWAMDIIRELDSYTEVSPSHTGIHVIVRAKLRAARNRKGRFEVYDQGRFFTITGERLRGTPLEVRARQSELDAVCERMFTEVADLSRRREPTADFSSSPHSDAELIERAGRAENGDKFRRLFSGCSDGYESDSEADQALVSILAFWCGPDPDRIDGLFRQSGRRRDKWEKRADYRNRTIQRAIDRNEFHNSTIKKGEKR